MKMRLLMDNETLPQRNLAAEEPIAYAVQQGIVYDTLRFWRSDKSVILGYSNHVSSEVNVIYAEEMGFKSSDALPEAERCIRILGI